ncbi:a-pheromone processing metallopeptidase ste23 [Xylariales sp. PMI_506]|nr:a-pheromone processing metallopeptidase ste23 [Xylariales sp. PMI_506]
MLPILESVELVTDQLERPLTDDRNYCVVRLPNDLEVFLAHDPTTHEAGACLNVEVGSMSDEIPGSAHALEHLVLRGTRKYPEEHDFDKYMAAHSGSKNATTSATQTCFYFQIIVPPTAGDESSTNDPSALHGALDRLAHLAIDAILHPETVERELHAVDSEYKMRLQSDERRLWQLERSTSNPEHPWNHFSVGNLQVLKEEPESRGINIRDFLYEFYLRHYSANRIKLAVVGREPLSVLANWVLKSFARIPNKKIQPNRWPDINPLTPSQLGVQLFVKPVKTIRELIIAFALMDESELHDSKPSRYLDYLLSHKASGSVFAYIKNKGWATNLTAGSFSFCQGSPGMYRCRISLTPEGCINYKEIVKVVFMYIGLLRDGKPQERFFQEAKSLAELHFRFKEKTPVRDFAKTVCARMQTSVPREWLLGPQCLRKFDPDAITMALHCLRPDNLRLTLVSPDGIWDQKEKWYGTEYRQEYISEEFINQLGQFIGNNDGEKRHIAELYLPSPNPFLPADLTIKKVSQSIYTMNYPTIPVLVRDDERARVWWIGDSMGVPKAYVTFLCRSSILYGSAENLAKADLLLRLVRESLIESTYEAQQAGMSYEVSFDPRGLLISIWGYNSKLGSLLELVVTTLRDLEVREDRFHIVKNKVIDIGRNLDFRMPYRQAITAMWWLTTENYISPAEKAAQLPGINLEALGRFKVDLLSQLFVESYVHGNVEANEARDLTEIIESSLNLSKLPLCVWPVRRSLKLPPGSHYCYNQDLQDGKEINNGLVYWMHIGNNTDPLIRASTRLLGQILSRTAFDWLRTKLQLGYVVRACPWPTYTASGFGIYIQGEYSCAYMARCVTAFLRAYSQWLNQMDETEFDNQKRSLITKILEKPKSLHECYRRGWDRIDDETYNFAQDTEDAKAIDTLRKSDIVNFYNSYITPDSSQCAKLLVNFNSRAVGKTETAPHFSFATNANVDDDQIRTDTIKLYLKQELKVAENELDGGASLIHEIIGEQELTDTEATQISDKYLFQKDIGG